MQTAGKLQNKDKMPSELAEKIIPVMEVNPKLLRRCNIIKNVQAANSTGATVYTIPATQDFYLVACSLSLIKDATATSVLTTLRGTIEGVVTNILAIPGITLTAQQDSMTLSFPYPLKIDRGTSITITHSTNVANILTNAGIIGYLDEQTLA